MYFHVGLTAYEIILINDPLLSTSLYQALLSVLQVDHRKDPGKGLCRQTADQHLPVQAPCRVLYGGPDVQVALHSPTAQMRKLSCMAGKKQNRSLLH